MGFVLTVVSNFKRNMVRTSALPQLISVDPLDGILGHGGKFLILLGIIFMGYGLGRTVA